MCAFMFVCVYLGVCLCEREYKSVQYGGLRMLIPYNSYWL